MNLVAEAERSKRAFISISILTKNISKIILVEIYQERW